ncbi:MAG: hypothetical protein NC299_13585 [Lachnospiraceae bacterium]|nr:hypothetical protein [Ruminococcus sp.]MCM1276367.1 hypothetical protein [Lachnospiraceae bacterium]
MRNDKNNGRKKSFGFVLEQSEARTLVFRFYPEDSHIHGFHDFCPTNWEQVYKTYYCWKICISEDDVRTSFGSYRDEDCCFTNYSCVIKELIANAKEDRREVRSLSGISWNISYRKRAKDYIEFGLWTHENIGYRFRLDVDTAKRFADFLEKADAYMMKHSEPM